MKAAAERAAAARATAERAAKAAAEKAAARAKAVASKAKAATKKHADDACHSFAAGTRVLLADGTSKPIDKVTPGDTVVAGSPAAGRSERRQVTHTIRTDHDRHFVDVTVRTSDGTHTITTTENHPFWSTTSKRWVDAAGLERGERLRTSDRSYAKVGAIREYDGGQRTYDLTIDAVHTYYVLAGSTPVLVHNCGVSPEPGPAPAGSTLEDYRNANVGPNAPRFVTEYTSPNGNRYYGRTTPGAVDIEPGSHLDDVAGRHHGGCSEVCALNEAQKAGDEILGGTFRTLKVSTGESVAPCEDFCQPMIRNLFGLWE